MNAADQLHLAPVEPRHATNHGDWAVEWRVILSAEPWRQFLLRFKTKAEADARLAAMPKKEGFEYRVYEQLSVKA